MPQDIFFRTALRTSRPLRSIPNRTRHFHSTPAIMVKVGDSIPSVPVFEDSPGNKVDLSQELASGKGLIIGVPAAFSPGCSDHHIPGYMLSDKLAGAGKAFVVSVNDAFVMKAWQKQLDAKSKNIRFVGDATGAFTEAMDTGFDATALLGNVRSKRYAIQTEDGKVTSVAIEPDNTGITSESTFTYLDRPCADYHSVSAADKVLG